MESTIVQWEFDEMKTKKTNASLAELKNLSKLSTLDIQITDAKMLPKRLLSKKLERFRIFIGDNWYQSGKYKTSKTLQIKLDTSVQREKGLRGLLKRTEDLYLDESKGITSSFCELDVLGFHQLKHLHIENSSDIQLIVNSTQMGPSAAFTRLESLFLDTLPNLKKIYDRQLLPKFFSNLRTLEVGSCNALENVVSSSIVRGLLHLEAIKIFDCRSLKEIVTEERKDGEGVKLPQLRKLVLDSLPQFSRFCSKIQASCRTQKRNNISETNTKLGEIVNEIKRGMPMELFDERANFNIKIWLS